MCPEPTNVARAVGQRLRRRPEVGPPPHRVLQLRAVRLDGELRARRRADRPAEQHVVREDEVGGEPRPHRRRVRLDPLLELLARAVGDAANIVEAVVAVDHEDRQEAADVRPHGRRSTEVVRLGPCLLAQDGDVVPGARPLPCELPGVDVRSGSAEEVSVPEQDAHPHILPRHE